MSTIICKSWEKQVLENTKDIAELKKGPDISIFEEQLDIIEGQIGDVEGQVSELNQQVAKTLKVPMTAPISTQLVSISTTNDQQMLKIGRGLSVSNGTLTSSTSFTTWSFDEYGNLPNTGVLEGVYIFECSDYQDGLHPVALVGMGSYNGPGSDAFSGTLSNGQSFTISWTEEYDPETENYTAGLSLGADITGGRYHSFYLTKII